MTDKRITNNIIVKADVQTVYRVWSNFENFPLFMKNIKEVTKVAGDTSHWVMNGPLGVDVKWEAEMTRDDVNKRIGWSTKDRDGDLTTSGQVTFNALPQGDTEISVTLHYVPKKGLAGDVVDKLFANPEKKLEEDLRNFKSYVEGMHDRATG